MSTGSHHEVRTQTRTRLFDGKAQLTLDVRDRRGRFRDDIETEVVLFDTKGERRSLEVKHLAPGLYRAEFPIDQYGDYYRLLIVQKQGEEVVALRSLAVTESYSPEFRNPLPDEEKLRLIPDKTSGIFEPDAEQLWKFEGEPARTPHETWWWWLIVAAVLLPLDIAIRRLV